MGDRSVDLGEVLTIDLAATDANGDALSFSASPLPLPAGASLGGTSGLFVFAPNAEQVGNIALTFRVSDGLASDSETITITVVGAAPGGVTAISGRLLDTNDFVNGIETPVVGATVSLLGASATATSDSNGDFLLSGIPGGHQVFDIDTATAQAAPDGSPYAGFREEIDLIAGVTNVIDRPFFLPRIAAESLTTVDPNVTTTVVNETLGTTLEVAPHTAKDEAGNDFTGELSISIVPDSLAPAALPEELEPGLAVTIQPVGVTFSQPAPISFPNVDNLPPGSEFDIWSLDAGTGTFVVVGTAVVSADGTTIETVTGGVRAPTGPTARRGSPRRPRWSA